MDTKPIRWVFYWGAESSATPTRGLFSRGVGRLSDSHFGAVTFLISQFNWDGQHSNKNLRSVRPLQHSAQCSIVYVIWRTRRVFRVRKLVTGNEEGLSERKDVVIGARFRRQTEHR